MSEKNTAQLVIEGLTDKGLVREHNEDTISWDIDLGLVILADGMGGHNAGEVASQLAVNCFTSAMSDVLSLNIEDNYELDLNDAIYESVIFANSEINQHAKENTECKGMGTTIVASLFRHDSAILASVGDSRIYCFRKGELKQLTTDHSLVQEMIDNGYMTEEEALESNNRNLITRALGIADDVQVDVVEHDVEENDIFLFCSDGLNDMVSDSEIFSVLVKTRNDLKRASMELIALAKKNGGKDNVSVILVTCKS